MSRFSIETDSIRNNTSVLRETADTLQKYGNEIASVQNVLLFSPSIQNGIGDSLSTLSQRTKFQSGSIHAMESALKRSESQYRRAEDSIVRNAGGAGSLFGKLYDKIPTYLFTGIALSPTISGLLLFDDVVDWLDKKAGDGVEISAKHEGELDLVDHLKKDDDSGKKNIFNIIDDFNEKHKKGLLNDGTDKNGKTKKTDSKKGYFEKGEDGKYHKRYIDENDKAAKEEFEKRFKGPTDAEIKFAGVGIEDEASLFSIKNSGENGIASGSAGLDVLKGEYSAEAYASTLGLGASVGASITALSLSLEGQLGNDMLGGHAKGEVNVGKAGISGDASIGLVDKDGHFNPNAHFGGSAEAIAVEATGTVGGKVLGTDVSVTGGVNVGVGAHADFGFQDGKLSFDVGASLGVGFSLSAEIDVSGTIKAVQDAASSAVNWISGVFGW